MVADTLKNSSAFFFFCIYETKYATLWPSSCTLGLLSQGSENLYLHENCTQMFLAALFLVAKHRRQLRCPSRRWMIIQQGYNYVIQYNSATKRNTLLIHAIIQMNPQWTILSEKKTQYKLAGGRVCGWGSREACRREVSMVIKNSTRDPCGQGACFVWLWWWIRETAHVIELNPCTQMSTSQTRNLSKISGW